MFKHGTHEGYKDRGSRGSQSHGSYLQDFLFTEFRSECHRIGERQGVFGNGPRKFISNLFTWSTFW